MDTTGTAKRTRVDAAAIHDAALRLFADRGYAATTMDDLGAALGVRGPSLYKHVRSKQEVLSALMFGTMEALIVDQRAALEGGGSPGTQLRRAVEAHIRFHASHRDEAFVGNNEIRSLESANREAFVELRSRYEQGLRSIIDAGRRSGDFEVPEPQLASYAILDMGIGVATWFNPSGTHSVESLAYAYAEHALRIVGARPDGR